MDRVADLLVPFGTLAAAVWVTLQAMPAWKGNHGYKLWLSFVLGPLYGMLGHAFGMVDPLTGLEAHKDHQVGHLLDAVDRFQHWGGAGFLGLISTMFAKAAHDYVINPMLSKGAPPPAPPKGGNP